MKPEKLTLFNIGPFVNEHTIDFNSLQDFFLISGKTGSGKTTILDSITYVLYGTLPGARKNIDTKNLRTHFCNEQELSYVDFIFSINENLYRVKRTLPYIYTTRNNTTRKEAETTEFYSLKNVKDTEGELISNQKTEADKSIKDLLQLNVEEFSKIVLLPQGEFATFLRQSTTERKTMLSKLFPVDNFTQITQNIKEEKTKLEIQLEQILQQLEFISKDFNIENFEQTINELNKTHSQNENDINTKQDRLYEIAGTLEKIETEISNQEEYEKLKIQLDKILSQQEYIEQTKEKTIKAKKALELFPLVMNIEKKENLINTTQINLTECESKLTILENKKIELQENENKISETENEIKTLEKKLNNLQESFSILKLLKENIINLENTNIQIDNTTKEFLNSKKNIKQITTFLTENKTKLNQKEFLQKEIFDLNKKSEIILNNKNYLEEQKKDSANKLEEEKLNEILEKQKLVIEDLKQQIETDKINELAHTFACNLKENSPCPVCGSTNHPNLAKKNENNFSKEENLKLQESLLSETEKKYFEVQRQRNISEGILINLKNKIDLSITQISEEIANEIKNKTDIIKTLENLETKILEEEQKLEQTKNENETISKKLNLLLQDKKLFEDRIKNQIETLSKYFTNQKIDLSNFLEIEKTLNSEIFNTKNNLENFSKLVKNFYEEQKQNSIDLSAQQEKKILLSSNLSAYKDELEIETKLLDEKIIKTNFSNTQEIKENYLEENKLITLENEIEQWTKEKEKLETLIQEKQNSFTSTKETLVEKQNQYKTARENLKSEINNLNFVNKQITEKISELNKSKTSYEKTENQRIEISEKLSDYKKLYKLLSGENPKKIDITSWILEMYLQEIILFANKRLSKISEGRYIMKVNTEKESNRGAKGLDIDVYDSFTGKSRPCNTLSGGETFMASISLALAISDTVQSKKGGIQLESLFIDEGFGSLDENSLEKAISILDEIRDSRKIGIISHVGDLKTRIKSSIEIEKTSSGSKIILL